MWGRGVWFIFMKDRATPPPQRPPPSPPPPPPPPRAPPTPWRPAPCPHPPRLRPRPTLAPFFHHAPPNPQNLPPASRREPCAHLRRIGSRPIHGHDHRPRLQRRQQGVRPRCGNPCRGHQYHGPLRDQRRLHARPRARRRGDRDRQLHPPA